MNAYELADKLEDDYWDSRANKVMLESAKILLQQQAEIEQLRNQLWELKSEPWGFDRHPEELKDAVRSFFQDFIDVREESDSGRVFAPITISSSRCMMIEPLAEVLAKMRKLSGSEK